MWPSIGHGEAPAPLRNESVRNPLEEVVVPVVVALAEREGCIARIDDLRPIALPLQPLLRDHVSCLQRSVTQGPTDHHAATVLGMDAGLEPEALLGCAEGFAGLALEGACALHGDRQRCQRAQASLTRSGRGRMSSKSESGNAPSRLRR